MNSNDSVMEVEWDESERKPELLVLTERQRRNFEKKVDKSGGPDACWPWTGYRYKSGYGAFSMNRRLQMAHRVAYANGNSPFPLELKVCHECDNEPCCNPAHLWLGIQANNVADMDAKGRRNMAKGDSNGSRTKPERRPRGERNTEAKLTEEQVRDIRASYVPRLITLQFLADTHGVKKCTVWSIVKGHTWRHVDAGVPPGALTPPG